MDIEQATKMLQDGQLTIRELRGITSEEMQAGVNAGRKLMEAGEHLAAAEILGGMALYDPFFADVWRALEELFRRERCPHQANLYADLARVMATS